MKILVAVYEQDHPTVEPVWAIHKLAVGFASAIRPPQSAMLVSPQRGPLKGDELPSPNIYLDLDSEANRIRKAIAPAIPWKTEGARDRTAFLSGLSDVIEQTKPDVVEVHNRWRHLPYISKMHPTVPTIIYAHSPVSHLAIHPREYVPYVTHAFFVSDALRRQFLKHAPGLSGKSSVVLNASSIESRAPKASPGRYLLFVGRIVPAKGLHLLLEAMRSVWETFPNTELLVAGHITSDTEYASGMLASCRQLPRVRYIGTPTGTELKHAYKSAYLTIMPSLSFEASGIVAMESMSCSTPVIAFANGGLRETIEHGVDGLLVNPFTVEEMATAILKLLQSESTVRGMGQRAHQKSKTRFTHDSRSSKIIEHYQHILGGTNG
jgi:spore coat protein SA